MLFTEPKAARTGDEAADGAAAKAGDRAAENHYILQPRYYRELLKIAHDSCSQALSEIL